MDNQPTAAERLLDAIEACRPGSADLGDPQFADLARQLAVDADLEGRLDQVQRVDAVIKAAFQEVPVPAGLQERLLAKLAEGNRPADANAPTPGEQARRICRRRVVWAMAAASVAASVLVVVALELRGDRPENRAKIAERSITLFASEAGGEGQLVRAVQPPEAYPFSSDLLRTPGLRWRRVADFLGSPAVAYDLSAAGAARATLYVVHRADHGQSETPPDSPTWSTAGYSAAVWQTGDALYVFVVEGDAQAYRSYLDLSRGPLT